MGIAATVASVPALAARAEGQRSEVRGHTSAGGGRKPRHPGRSGKSGFPPEYRKLAPARKLEWLGGPEAHALVARRVLQFNQLAAEARRIHQEKLAVRSR